MRQQPTEEWMTSPDAIKEELRHDRAVKVAGCDIDGILRGKLMAKSKFFSLLDHSFTPAGGHAEGEVGAPKFGFCSVIFGWDMHDQTYVKELAISNKDNGYRDILARVDLSSFRRIPWEPSHREDGCAPEGMPFFLIDFLNPDKPTHFLDACPRGFLETIREKLDEMSIGPKAGAEYEFYTFKAPNSDDSSGAARFLQQNAAHLLPHLSEGMMGYSLTDPVKNQAWYEDMFKVCEDFGCPIEGWHTESGPGVFEAALKYDGIREMADQAALFKLATKAISTKHSITPCFMAKPRQGLPGNSGHIHLSLTSKDNGSNLFAAPNNTTDQQNSHLPFPELKCLSSMAFHFLAGLLHGLPDILVLLAPTVNSYKRLVENFWAPVTVSWGVEHRSASIRIVAPPSCPPAATRFEIRVPGADANPYLVLAGLLAIGWHGVEQKMEMKIPPMGRGDSEEAGAAKGERLPKSLKEATARFRMPKSVARKVLGNEFVDHFAGTRDHEIRLWEECVTDWEVQRYIEMV